MPVRCASLADCDTALTECARRLRQARASRDREAVTVYLRQLNWLLDWRHEHTR